MSAVRVLSLIIIVALISAAAWAQDLDRGKSGAKLFAANCANCHHSPRGLAKGRFSWTLSYFLRQHYTSGSVSAQELAAYLQSVDLPRAKAAPATRKSRSKAANTWLPSFLRPSAPVPNR